MDNDIFECIRCGAQVYHAASQCPHCGLDLYPEELEEEHVPDEPLPRLTLRRFSPAGALLIGGILSLVFTFGWLSLRLVFANVNSAGGQAILLLAGPLAALLAGYGDCALLRKLLPLHGLLLGVFTTFNAVVLSAIWRDAAFTRTLFHSLTPAILALCLLGSFAGQLLSTSTCSTAPTGQRRPVEKTASTSSSSTASASTRPGWNGCSSRNAVPPMGRPAATTCCAAPSRAGIGIISNALAFDNPPIPC